MTSKPLLSSVDRICTKTEQELKICDMVDSANNNDNHHQKLNNNNNNNNNNNKSLNPIEVQQIIDLTDKPIRLERQLIDWSRVRANASNCICCCYNNSITLITTNESYILDHIPLDNILKAQVSHNLQNLALSNEYKLAIIDLINQGDEFDLNRDYENHNNNNYSKQVETKFVNLASYGLSMSDILFWRWLDETTLAIMSNNSLYICSLNQPQISHPAMSALVQKTHLLSMKKVCDIDESLSECCQIIDIQRDNTTNLYAITGICNESLVLNQANQLGEKSQRDRDDNQNSIGSSGAKSIIKEQQIIRTRNLIVSQVSATAAAVATRPGPTMRPSFGSVPSRLSQMVNGNNINDQSFDSIKSDNFNHNRKWTGSTSTLTSPSTNIPTTPNRGLIQVHCRMRDCSQLIFAQAVAFTSTLIDSTTTTTAATQVNVEDETKTILITAERIGNRLKVHFVPMITHCNSLSSYQHASPTIEFHSGPEEKDYPTSIVCTNLNFANSNNDENDNNIAMVTTKFGQLIVCSIKQRAILFTTQITTNIICNVVLESNTKGLMVICNNGQVLLVKLNESKLMHLLDESKRKLRHISSCHSFSNVSLLNNNNLTEQLHYASNLKTLTTTTATVCRFNRSNNENDNNNLNSNCKSNSIGPEAAREGGSSGASGSQSTSEHQQHSSLGINLEVLISTKL